jgi:hypothetical protein
MALNNRLDQLRDFRAKPNFFTLGTNQRRDFLELVEFVAPGLLVGYRPGFETSAALRASGGLVH